MRITALEEYGLRCLLTLAQAGTEGQLSITEISEKEGLSIPYTSKLLSILRKSGLVKAVRGRSGGFCISRKPKDINLLDAITALGGPLIDPNHCDKYSGQLDRCIHTDNCSVHYAFAGLSKIVGEFLRDKSIEDVLKGNGFIDIKNIQSNVTLTDVNYENELNEALNEPLDESNNQAALDKLNNTGK